MIASKELMMLSIEAFKELWETTYNTSGKPDWSHILPYYDENIYFKDSIQALHGMAEFRAMTERLTARSQDLKMRITEAVLSDKTIMMEWEMTISYKKYPSSIVYGASKLTFNDDGKIIIQRDYYDLWGDIFDNIPFLAKRYRNFMKKKFG